MWQWLWEEYKVIVLEDWSNMNVCLDMLLLMDRTPWPAQHPPIPGIHHFLPAGVSCHVMYMYNHTYKFLGLLVKIVSFLLVIAVIPQCQFVLINSRDKKIKFRLIFSLFLLSLHFSGNSMVSYRLTSFLYIISWIHLNIHKEGTTYMYKVED